MCTRDICKSFHLKRTTHNSLFLLWPLTGINFGLQFTPDELGGSFDIGEACKEIFFKWIKQHLRIKSFFGTSQNAVKRQIWIAVSPYVLVAIVNKRLKTNLTLYTILQILSITLFEKIPILQALTADDYKTKITSDHIQLKLFES